MLLYSLSVNIHGAHSYWRQGALGTAGVMGRWAAASGVQRAGILCRHAHSLLAKER